jgi:chromatin assembly factor 1 subunit A
VRDIIDKLTDAEVCGDEDKVFLLSKQLMDRRRIPVKTLTFAEDSRPGYSGETCRLLRVIQVENAIGTWTRTTAKVGPRTPFARDFVALDYDCDSGEDWEEEAEGDEVLSGSDSGDGDGSDQDSLDGWLIDDDEDVGGEPIDLDQMDIDGLNLPNRKRKSSPALEPPKSKSKKRKFAKPLVPFSKGPCWEIPVGNCSQWEGLTPYRIQIFNGKPGLVILN